jgi:hypothetical protein
LSIGASPRIASRLQAQLAAFAALAQRADAPEHDYGLARKAVIEAIAALSDFGRTHERRAGRGAQRP